MRTKVILFILLGMVVASTAFLLLRDRGADAHIARITRDGVLLEEIDLDKVDEPYSFTVEDESGSNTILAERGRIRVSEADCPDRICVNQGYISDSAAPIVCLPHKLIIEIVGGGGELDGAAG